MNLKDNKTKKKMNSLKCNSKIIIIIRLEESRLNSDAKYYKSWP